MPGGVTTSNADPNVMQAMDNAAAEAENDLTNVSEEAIAAVATWWKKWYMAAGHKRLGRVLVSQVKK